ncbi:hypothetical protein AB3X48_00380 [Bacillus sp. S4]|uniref:hypothetical protein n=1 Tax=unclassified Bacillus (in: firmicutes) TaxID=185979 RepID=UPI0030F707D3
MSIISHSVLNNEVINKKHIGGNTMEYVDQRRAEYEAWKKEQAAKKEAEKVK